MKPRANLQQIATLTGVSKMTVSRALREGTSVDAKLREKIRETAVRVSYIPDPRISFLMSQVRRPRRAVYRETLAFVWTHRSVKNQETYFNGGFEGARLRAEHLGCKLDEFHIKDQSLSGRALSRILYSRGIRGVLIAPPCDQRPYPHAWLEWNRFCCVLIGRSMVNAGVARVQHDHFSATVMAVRHLKKLRYKRLGLVLTHSMDERSLRLVRSAFLSFHPGRMAEAEKLIFTGDAHDAGLLAKWLEKNKPGAVIANFEDPFPKPEHILPHLSKETGLVSLNWSNDHPEIAGISHQLPLIGEEAVDLLTRRLQKKQMGLDPLAPVILVPGTWVNGSSIHPL